MMRAYARVARLVIPVVALAAAINVAIGLSLALRDPSRASDLDVMYDWCRRWLFDGERLYSGISGADYPPNAIVFMSPIALLPHGSLVAAWTMAALVLLPALAIVVARTAAAPREPVLLPILLFFCWTASRTLLQFSVLSLTLAFLAIRIADARPTSSGVALGLALFKPHIAGPCALWALATGHMRVVVTAAATVLGGLAIYDLRVGETPVATLRGYATELAGIYFGAQGPNGRTGVRGFTTALAPNPWTADVLWLAAAAVLFVVTWWIARWGIEGNRSGGGFDDRIAVPALFCLWSLLAVYHNTNNLVLVWPAFAFLWFAGSAREREARWLPIALLQAALMFDVPTRLAGVAPAGSAAARAVEHFDRVVVVACFAYVAVVWSRARGRW